MSSGYISDYFKKATGISFTKHIHLKKIENAKEMLKRSDKSINDIAQEIGFENTNSFIRVFKQYEGVTPGQYRKVHMP